MSQILAKVYGKNWATPSQSPLTGQNPAGFMQSFAGSG
jgi:hypothetical protein